MRILFIGTVDFSYAALSLLLENKYDVVGLVTKRKSGFNSDFSDLQPLAEKYGVPVVFREQNNDDEIETFIESKHPDVIYCLGWSHLLPSRILRIPRYGVVGFHPAALPDNKGRHPIIWALFLGLKNTASTFFFMDEGADSGDIILQENIVIDEDDTAATLYEKIQKKKSGTIDGIDRRIGGKQRTDSGSKTRFGQWKYLAEKRKMRWKN